MSPSPPAGGFAFDWNDDNPLTMPTASLRSLHVTPDAASISAVRDFVRECCADWGVLESSDTAVLLASELATNAVRYAATPVAVWLATAWTASS